MKNKRKITNILSVGIIVLFLGLIMFNKNPDKFLNNIMLSPNEPLNIPGEIHFKEIRQLTFSGENAEAYFSSDGRKLIFQAHDGEKLCDQIYIMDIETGKTKLVSTGDGVTTCGYFQYPDNDKIIYSSTHHHTRECPPPPDFSKGYVWKLHPEFDVFRSSPDGRKIEQLTNTWGYDAEATYAEDGSKIVYTSMAGGDLDVWTMSPDGSRKRQLTKRLGYDGGPFFSHDGTKIVWRAYYPENREEADNYNQLLKENAIRPMSLQIRIMNADGTGKAQVTNNSAANFGPFFYPNDERIVFCSNVGDPDGRNFDLWAIDTDGSNLEQITFFEGFDGFPMFSPNGKFFVFSSNRNQAKHGDTNIFICEWID